MPQLMSTDQESIAGAGSSAGAADGVASPLGAEFGAPSSSLRMRFNSACAGHAAVLEIHAPRRALSGRSGSRPRGAGGSPPLARGLACLLCMFAAACSRGSGAAPPPAPPPPLVYVAEVKRQDLTLYNESLADVSGYVDAEIRARVRGFLKTQHYRDGGQVKAGDLLFTIDPREFENAVASANAGVTRARAASSRNRVMLDRSQGLYQTGMVSQQGLDDARTGVADTGGQLDAAQASLDQAKLNLSYTQIRSPIDGVAGLALVRVGNLVGQDGPTLLTTVSQLDPVRVTFTLSEVDYIKDPQRFHPSDARDLGWAQRQFAKLAADGTTEQGDPGIELLLADGNAYPHRGVVVTLDRQIDSRTGTLRLQALVPNPDGVLRPGQYARVRVRRSDAGRDAVTVPEKALVMVQNTYSVAVVGQGNKVHLQRVRTGALAAGERVIEEGLQGGERIVVEGLQKVSDGIVVRPETAHDAAGSSAAPDVAAKHP